jgi:hypothetical protein
MILNTGHDRDMANSPLIAQPRADARPPGFPRITMIEIWGVPSLLTPQRRARSDHQQPPPQTVLIGVPDRPVQEKLGLWRESRGNARSAFPTHQSPIALRRLAAILPRNSSTWFAGTNRKLLT